MPRLAEQGRVMGGDGLSPLQLPCLGCWVLFTGAQLSGGRHGASLGGCGGERGTGPGVR